MCDMSSSRTLLSEVSHLLQIALTIPVSTATTERTFSVLHCLKTFLHSSVTQPRFNHIMMLHIHKEQTDNLDLSNVLKDFLFGNATRMAFLEECKSLPFVILAFQISLQRILIWLSCQTYAGHQKKIRSPDHSIPCRCHEFTLSVWPCMTCLSFMLYDDSNSIRASHSLGALSTKEAENHKNNSK